MANADFNSIILNEASIDDSTGTPVPNIGTFIGESGGTVSMAVSQTTFLRGTPPLNIVSYQKPYGDRKSTRLNSSHLGTSYAVFCLKKPKGAARLPERAARRARCLIRGAPPRREGARSGHRRGPLFFLMIRRPPRSTLFPYPTLSR